MTPATKTVIITGSSSGIGLDIARAFLVAGANVVHNGRDPDKLARVAEALVSPDRVAFVAGNIGTLALLNRVGEVEEVSAAVLYLADAAFTTGQILRIDGGFVTGRA